MSTATFGWENFITSQNISDPLSTSTSADYTSTSKGVVISTADTPFNPAAGSAGSLK
ncbi:hypothetical protein [Ensifer aridi]|uniref:hypothetical protein n=1 Tax=Ensifer aridi TaxID=1708715 RepID=UPI001430838F|nr:hypothetical protein [Ensifer aridi]